MKKFYFLSLTFSILIVPGSLRAQGTAFLYQGHLQNNGNTVSGSYDVAFTLYTTNVTGTALAGPVTNPAVAVSNGLFTTTVDFGNVFTGTSNWLELAVSTNGANAYSTLAPRQQLLPVPYAITAANLSGPVSATSLSGALANANLPANPTVAGTVTAGSFYGNGANLTNVNAVALNGLNATNLWQTGGNNVTAGQFFGSTNNQPVEFWANNQQLMQLAYATNTLNGSAPNLLAGYAGNSISNGVIGATICGGGCPNPITDKTTGALYGGYGQTPVPNIVGADFGTVVGGAGNTASGLAACAMGLISTASGTGSTAMGAFSTASGIASTAMGDSTASNECSTAMGNATAVGSYSTAMGQSAAFGYSSLAAGFQAYAIHSGTFVWADAQINAPFATTASNQFLIRAAGNVGINTTTPGAPLHVANGSSGVHAPNPNSVGAFESSGNGYVNLLTPTANESGVLFGNLNATADGGIVYNNGNTARGLQFRTAGNLVHMAITSTGNVGIGTTTPAYTLDVQGNINANGKVYANGLALTSDRNAKENFKPVDNLSVLAKVAALPVTEWNYKTDLKDVQHIGPMAQDFQAAFGLDGADDKHISVVDEGGVALAAIQGLNQKLNEKDVEIEALKQSLSELKQLVQSLAEKK